MNAKSKMKNQLIGPEKSQTIHQMLPKNIDFIDARENTCDIAPNDLMDLENILINRSPFVKAAVGTIRNVLETHPALLENDVELKENDLAK